MSHKNGQCRGINAQGDPCKAHPNMVDENGWCPAHGPGAQERLREQGKKGGAALRRKWQAIRGLEPEDLGPLDTHEDAKRWLEVIGKAVLSNTIDSKAAHAGARAVETWLKAEGERVTMTVVEDLKAEIDRLKAELKGRPNLQSA